MAVVSYKCINCGGALQFNPEKQKFSCDYCLSDFAEQQLIEYYKDLDRQLDEKDDRAYQKEQDAQKEKQQAQDKEAEDFEAHAVEYVCPSCGAQVITSDTTAATKCYYCHNNVVIGSRLTGDLKPDMVIPFKISREKAIADFEAMCKKKKFLPHHFFSKQQVEQMTGIYYPYWYVDSEGTASATAKAQKVRAWRAGEYDYKEIKKYNLYRKGDVAVKRLSFPALSKEQEVMLKSVHPYQVNEAVRFSMSYLSGFQAEKRDIEKAQLEGQSAAEIDKHAQQLVKNTMKQYTSVQITSFNRNEKSNIWRYTLLPVWVLSYQFSGQNYLYGINGQTGKTYGKLPVSWKRLGVLWGIIVAAVMLIYGIGEFLL